MHTYAHMYIYIYVYIYIYIYTRTFLCVCVIAMATIVQQKDKQVNCSSRILVFHGFEGYYRYIST